MQPTARDVLMAGLWGAVLSGVPSVSWTLIARDDLLASTRAAGTLLPGRRPGVVRGLAAHAAVSAGWTLVFAAVDRRRRLGPVSGAVLGLGVAALDLGVVGRRFPAVAALAQPPQWADHAAFGAIVGYRLHAAGQGGRLR